MPSRLKEYVGWYFRVCVRVRLSWEASIRVWGGGGCPPFGFRANRVGVKNNPERDGQPAWLPPTAGDTGLLHWDPAGRGLSGGLSGVPAAGQRRRWLSWPWLLPGPSRSDDVRHTPALTTGGLQQRYQPQQPRCEGSGCGVGGGVEFFAIIFCI